MSDIPQSQVLAYLAFLTGPLVGTTIPLTQPVVTLGRAPTNDIVIADPKVSRVHARLTLQDGSWHIEKLSQSSSVWVDQQHIDQATLASHSQVNLGGAVSFRFLLALERGVLIDQSGDQDNITHEVGDTIQLRTERSSTPMPTVPVSSLQHVPGIPIAVGKTTEVGKPSDMGIASLEVLDNSTGAHKEYALLRNVMSIGQDAANDIVLPEQSVSDFHLQIIQQDGQWTILHPHPQRRETRNGLLFAGRKIKGKEEFRQVLKSGDTFRIANDNGTLVTLTFRDGQKHEQEFLPRMEIVPLEHEEIRIGRSQENTLVLNHPQVSAYHALLTKEQDAWRLIDLNSTNHTYVNGLAVTNHLLTGGDEIRIGAFKIAYHASQLVVYDESGGIRIDVLNLGQVRNRHILLNDISLSIPQRSFVALVGASGAGKSTLLNAISGLQPASEGSVFYNGQNYYEHLAAFKTQIGYVPQDEIIHRDLSVERALYYAARLRLPKDFTRTQIEQRINEVLDDVEMQHLRTHLVRQLSGGQRKRVSIALELLANPSIFFLDEPTSGLDPGLDRKMMVLLRKLADKGHTIVLVTHATNNINICDYVCFLAPGGHLAYFGPPEQAKAYFRQGDFAEIYEVLEPGSHSSDASLEVAEQFQQSEEYQIYVDKPLSHRPKQNTQLLRQSQKQRRVARRGTSWRQFFLLSLRYLELLKNDRVNLAILLLQAPIIGLLLLIFIKGVGLDGFNPNNVLRCPATSAIIASAGFHDVPTPLNPIVSTSCQRVEHFLQSNPAGIAYANHRGSVLAALQDFLVPGPDFSPTVLFIMVFSAVTFGCLNSAREFVKEAPIYRRERAVNLGIIPYMFSKIVVLGFFCLFQSLILVGCVAVFDPFHRGTFLPPFLEIYIPIALTSLVGLMIGLTVSALVSNNDRAMSFVPLVLIPQVLFSGVIFPLSSWFLQYLGMFFPIRWSMAALGSSIGLHSDKLNGDQLIAAVNTYQSTLFSTTSSQDATHYLLLTWLALVAMIFLLGIASSIFLKRKDTHQSP
jgi:ABC transport system ATP-binding/permease protein